MIVRDSVDTDPRRLGPFMRDADVAEVQAYSGNSPQGALESAMKASSHSRTLTDEDGQPIGMFGVVPDLQAFTDLGIRYGFVWFLGADAATQNPKLFMKMSREWLDRLSTEYDFLGNFVDARNSKHIKWLKAMGFDFTDVDPYHGYERRCFLEFIRPCREDASV